jgi:hypothetical protein
MPFGNFLERDALFAPKYWASRSLILLWMAFDREIEKRSSQFKHTKSVCSRAQQTLSIVAPSCFVGFLEIEDHHNEHAG